MKSRIQERSQERININKEANSVAPAASTYKKIEIYSNKTLL